jgi:hypothetical protein
MSSQDVTGVLQPVSWSHSLVRDWGGPAWASRVANLGTCLFLRGREGCQATSRTSSSTGLQSKLSTRSRFGRLTEGRGETNSSSRSVTPLFMHLTPLASRLAAVLPPLQAIRARASDVDQSHARFHHSSNRPGQPIPAITSYCLYQVGFIFLLFPSESPLSTAFKPAQR